MARMVMLGQSGTGKSYGQGCLLERALDPSHPDNGGETFDMAVHFDPEDEERGLSDPDNNPLFATLNVDVKDARRINWAVLIAGRERVRVVPDMRTGHSRQLFGVIAQACFKIAKDHLPNRSILLSCDESGDIVTQNGAADAALEVQTRGRKHGLETIHACQRPQQLHTTILSQVDRRFYFRISGDNDVRKINGQSGFDVNRIPVESEHINPGDGIQDLPNRVVVAENTSNGEIAVESTENWTRKRPHYAGDDGVLDSVLGV